jgi:hypothetical protein
MLGLVVVSCDLLLKLSRLGRFSGEGVEASTLASTLLAEKAASAIAWSLSGGAFSTLALDLSLPSTFERRNRIRNSVYNKHHKSAETHKSSVFMERKEKTSGFFAFRNTNLSISS